MPHPLHDTIGNGGERLGLHLIVETPTGDAYVNPRPVAVVRQARSGVRRGGFDLNHGASNAAPQQ